MSESQRKTSPRTESGVPIFGGECAHCGKGFRGHHTRRCPVFKRDLVERLEMRVNWYQIDLKTETDRKQRNRLIAKIARYQKRIARLTDTTFDRTEHDRQQSMSALDALEILGGKQQ